MRNLFFYLLLISYAGLIGCNSESGNNCPDCNTPEDGDMENIIPDGDSNEIDIEKADDEEQDIESVELETDEEISSTNNFMIDEKGGTYSSNGLTLTIGEGAVDNPVEITITHVKANDLVNLKTANGQLIDPLSDIWKFSPEGLEFKTPVKVSIPYTKRSNIEIAFYWTLKDDTSLFRMIDNVEYTDDIATAEIKHFSRGLVAPALNDDGSYDDLGPFVPGDECLKDADCEENLICIGGRCKDNINFSDSISWISHIASPHDFELSNYGFDYDGDGTIDNAMNNLLTLINSISGGDLSFSSDLWDAIKKDLFTTMIEFTVLPESDGELSFRLLNGWFNDEYDTYIEDDFIQQYKGNGKFRVNRKNFLRPHKIVTFNGTLTGDTLEATAENPWRIVMKYEPDIMEAPIKLPLYNLRMKAQIKRDQNTLRTIDVNHDPDYIAGTPVMIEGSAMLGAIVPLDALVESMNSVAKSCACIDLDPDKPLIDYKVEGGKFYASCNQDVSEAANNCPCCNLYQICTYMQSVCDFLPFLTNLADLSTGKPGIDGVAGYDAISAALAVAFQPATLYEDPLTPIYYTTDDYYYIDDYSKEITVPVIDNDCDAIRGEATIISVSKPSDEGQTRISEDGKSIIYTPPNVEDYDPWEVLFTYTIKYDGEENKELATAGVELR